MAATTHPVEATPTTLSPAAPQRGFWNLIYLKTTHYQTINHTNPLSTEGKERVIGRSLDRVSLSQRSNECLYKLQHVTHIRSNKDHFYWRLSPP